MRYHVHFDQDRIEQAKNRRIAHYRGDRTAVIPHIFTVPSNITSKAWISNNPYSFTEMLHDPVKCVEGQVLGMQYQCDTYPDSDWLPVFQTFMFGEGFIPSLLGAKQIDGDEMPPFQEGRILSSVHELDRLPERIDPSLGYGPIAREALLRMVDAFDGYVPIVITDHQSPYGVATKLLENEELMLAMYDEPELVHQLMAYATQAISDTVELISGWIGKENLVLNPTISVPEEGGIILWDDYVSVISPAMHEEFCRPYNARLYQQYGRGHLHTCGPYFPNYLDAVVGCDPVSVDMAILSGMSRNREDMLRLKTVLNQRNIILNGGLQAKTGSVFDVDGTQAVDREFFLQMAKGKNLIWQESASVEQLNEYKKWLAMVQ